MTSDSRNLGLKGSAERVLREAGEPLHYREITRRALERGWLATRSKTPETTLNAAIAAHIKSEGEQSLFIRTGRGILGLREWAVSGAIEVEDESALRVFIVYYPVYEATRSVLPVWVGEPADALTGMRGAVQELSGTPQEPQDWTDPDTWIEERLSGEIRRLALATWREGGGTVNPRYIGPHWRLITGHTLVTEDDRGRLALTERGRAFLQEPGGAVEQEIDQVEGLAELLSLVAELGPASRSDLLGPFGEYLRTHSRLRSDTAVNAAQWARIRNLRHRGLVERAGSRYVVTQAGLDYLQQTGARVEPTSDQELRRLLTEQKTEVRQALHEYLLEMDPYAFEHLIKRLLEEMGYDEVEVTNRSGDRGIDVVGHIELGITSVREVIQAKRYRSRIGRPVLDALRGTLHRFRAVRGTIITTGRLTRGTQDAAFEPGAPPITLIDGERLVDLLVEHGLGVKKKRAELWEIDLGAFTGLLPEEGEEEEA